jgi:hypothetical protein
LRAAGRCSREDTFKYRPEPGRPIVSLQGSLKKPPAASRSCHSSMRKGR